ncbi:MAG: putative Ig domain-containing protein, partial [Blastocatellia bacterium]|nr:putative Ig domain-containing protein [Blastocatellia bacterium]
RTLLGGGLIGSYLHVLTNPLFGEFWNERLAIDPLDIAIGGPSPVLSVPLAQVGAANSEIRFTVSASDIDSLEPLKITAEGLPPGASFTTTAVTNDRTTGAFTWTPTTSDVGRSFAITFTASDGQLSDTKQVTVSVVDASPLALSNATASASRQLAVDSIATVAGSNLATETRTAPTSRLPIDLAGTRVTINGIPAPLFSG